MTDEQFNTLIAKFDKLIDNTFYLYQLFNEAKTGFFTNIIDAIKQGIEAAPTMELFYNKLTTIAQSTSDSSKSAINVDAYSRKIFYSMFTEENKRDILLGITQLPLIGEAITTRDGTSVVHEIKDLMPVSAGLDTVANFCEGKVEITTASTVDPNAVQKVQIVEDLFPYNDEDETADTKPTTCSSDSETTE